MTVAVDVPDNASLEHLKARLAAHEARVRAAVARRRAADPTPDDRFRGLYLSDQAVDHLLDSSRPSVADFDGDAPLTAVAEIEAEADGWAAAGAVLRLREIAASFGLDTVDVELLLIALAPDVDPRFEQLYGYLHDDVTRRRASVGLGLELCRLSLLDPSARARLAPAGILVARGLIVLEDLDRPALTRGLRVPDRVTAYLLGSDEPDADLDDVIDHATRPEQAWPLRPLTRAMARGTPLVYLREAGMASGAATAAASVVAFGAAPLVVDLARVVRDPGRAGELAAAAVREARLASKVLVAGPVDALVGGSTEVIRQLSLSASPAILVGQRTWDPAWSPVNPVVVDLPAPSAAERTSAWQGALATIPPAERNGHADGLLSATSAFRLTGPQVARAAEAGLQRARAAGHPIRPADLQAAARAQNAAGLDHLARRIEPAAGWQDLVVPAEVRALLRELGARARHRGRVLDDWRVGGRSSRGRGITALFAGESGTGKTLAAEVIAAELGLDLYVIDLSTVVDKYIGETEKNLDRIFTAADRVNGVLLFDEADAIFGKRSEVRDARDRYANVEVAYLLQRMERFDGLAILTTNLRANLDDAFTRRIDVIVDFPMPDEHARLALWRMHLPEQLPQGPDLDLGFMAHRFRLAGGNIRNICLTAAFLAADAEVPVSMAEVIRGTEREYRKLGRLTLEDEFGPYHSLLLVGTAAHMGHESQP